MFISTQHEEKKKLGLNADPFLLRKAKQSFYNISPLDMKKLMGDQDHIKENLFSYIQGFSEAVRDIFERFEFYAQIVELAVQRYKRIFGNAMKTRALPQQKIEAWIRASALNRMTNLGMPMSIKV